MPAARARLLYRLVVHPYRLAILTARARPLIPLVLPATRPNARTRLAVLATRPLTPPTAPLRRAATRCHPTARTIMLCLPRVPPRTRLATLLHAPVPAPAPRAPEFWQSGTTPL